LRDADKWKRDWKLTERAILHTVEFLTADAEIPNTRLLPSEYLVIVPAVVMHVRKGSLRKGEGEFLRKWVFVAGAFAHYSGSTETTLGSDLNTMGYLSGDPKAALLREAQAPRSMGSKLTPQDIHGRGMRSPYLKLLQLRAVQTKAQSWWSHRALNYGASLPSLDVEVHHVFPKAWLRKNGLGGHPDRDTLANFAFLSKFDNVKISDSDPRMYFKEATARELQRQWIPKNKSLWAPGKFTEFCAARCELMADALNEMLGLRGPIDGENLEIADELDEPEVGAWLEDHAADPELMNQEMSSATR
jgi:hypothetical protein